MIDARSKQARVALQVSVTLMVLPFLLPIVAAVRQSLQGDGPLVNYGAVLGHPGVPRFFLNSLYIATATMVISCVTAVLAAYAFAKLRMAGRELVFYALLAVMTLPTIVLTVPLFLTMQRLGLFGSPWSVILPLSALLVPFNTLVARAFIEGVPDELLSAAAIDGASDWQTFLRVVLPLARPVVAVIAVLSLLAAWNEYLLPLLFLHSPQEQTVTLLPTFFAGRYTNDYTKITAASVIVALPTIVVYLLAQRVFERGIAAGAIR
jgi:raffinose/stachyose/melibiose transport system permease protein